MTVSSVTSAPPATPAPQSSAAKPQTPAASAAEIKDTVHLSAEAQGASGEGDCH
jgi:hypothetical protein